ncbi:pectinesterase family protein [uncultured Microbulbifer sp.]|uniref:pectinesterase family protein n=1 Tax=uncultured Microbulbifer sp. TaxID=348147 RepID=UPI0025CBB5BB|nr:pectinesterase family protein [uncultured Microbulbifer sp.]
MRVHGTYTRVAIAALLGSLLAGCSDDSSKRELTQLNPMPDEELVTIDPPPEPEPEPEPEPDPEPTVFTCPDSGFYFCDDFEDGEFASSWDAVIDGYGLADPGVFDILDEGDKGKSLRFTAGTRGENLREGELILVKEAVFGSVPADYFVEYRIRPRQNGNTGNKYLYGIGRYQGPLQWYFGGLNMQNSSESTQVEAGYAATEDAGATGSVSREVQAKKPILLGEQGATDGSWYTVRYDIVGSDITVYLDGEELGTYSDADSKYTTAGRIGFFTYNRSFEVDYVKVGDPAVKPVQLTIDYAEPSWTATAGDPALEINVTAIQSDGVTADTFEVVSSDDSVVSAEVSGNLVKLSPLAEGSAEVTFISGSDSSLQRSINVEVAKAFAMPTATYGDISSLVTPLPGATGEYEDTRLSITFDNAPTLNAEVGSVRIFRADDNTEVDAIRAAGETDTLGYNGQAQTRTLNATPFSIDGNTLTVSPHTDVLQPGVEYFVAISSDLVQGAKLNGSDFVGLGKDAAWTFTTRAALPSGADVTVDDDGAGDFRTVQGALNHVMENVAADDPATITINAGDYREMLYLSGKNNLTIKGAGADQTRIHYENYDGLNGGSEGRSLFLVKGGDMITLTDLTIENTHQRTGAGDQAETIYFNSEGRLIARDASFISEQDTLLLKGYNWFYNTLVAGNVDFIWGYSTATVFEESEIRSLGDSKSSEATSGGGYILQARNPTESVPGFVFLNSKLTHGAGPTGVTIEPGTTYLARSGGSSSYFDNIAFINTAMDTHVADIGWRPDPIPNPSTASADSGWREYGSTDLAGNPLDLSNRCSNDGTCYQLSAEEVATRFCSRAQIFAGWNSGEGWDPYPEDTSDDDCVVASGPSETWSGNGLLVGDSSQSSATVASGSISEQTDNSVTFTASDGKFETMAQSFYLVSQQVTGDFILTAKLKSVGENYAANQFPVGLMMCECDATAGTTSPLAHVGMHMSGSEWVTQYGHVREAAGGWGKASGDAVVAGDSLYFKLERQGQAYYASVSTDGGVSYTELGANTFTGLPDSIKVGLFAAPYNDNQNFTFEDIQLTQ